MQNPRLILIQKLFGMILLTGYCAAAAETSDPDLSGTRQLSDLWRTEHRLIDLHQHIGMTTQHLARAIKIMDAAGLGIAVNLGSGYVTPGKNGSPSGFERCKQLTDKLYPGRFLHYFMLDYRDWDQPDFSAQAIKQIEEARRLGAAGLKESKRLGLFQRDGAGKLIQVDDPKLDPVWKRCGELNLPISIHVADPKAFWLPFNDTNERWKELKDHKSWWFGDTNKFPVWKELLESLNRVIARHPNTTFVCVHFANNAEELDWVDASLSRYPNMMADLAARIPELGRHDPAKVRQLILKHQDRILFGTDFMVGDRLILGSSGNEPPPTDQDAVVFYQKHWRWFETSDRDWSHMTPIQGDWTISSIGLPVPVLRKIYFDNARKLLARSLPQAVMKAVPLAKDFSLDGDLSKPVWRDTAPVRLEYGLADGAPRSDLSTAARCLWSSNYLYFSFECPYTQLTVWNPPSHSERLGLWQYDVVEVFLGTDLKKPSQYMEFEVAPTNERLDVKIRLPEKDFAWDSRFESAVKVDAQRRVWTAELRIPLTAMGSVSPISGARWRINLFRSDCAQKAFLAFNPPLVNTTHAPARFGWLEF